MYQKERLDEILELLHKYGYVTVKYLVNALHYSNATINRDLNVLESQGEIHRTHGGVEIAERKGVPLPFRYHKMKAEKLKIGKKASELVQDGETLFIDGSTTTEAMAEFLVDKKGITVITNNITLVMRLCEYGIKVICLGGTVVEKPSMLGGDEAVESAMKYTADKMFFSTNYVSKDGKIGTGGRLLLMKAMAKNSDKVYYLADHDKLVRPQGVNQYIFDFNEIDGVISDYEFDEEVQNKYPFTQFIKA